MLGVRGVTKGYHRGTTCHATWVNCHPENSLDGAAKATLSPTLSSSGSQLRWCAEAFAVEGTCSWRLV